MTQVTVKEMRTVSGGATYTRSCQCCGKRFSTSYWGWSWISKNSAIVAVNGRLHKHELNCCYKYFR